jgi:hypothetical protein
MDCATRVRMLMTSSSEKQSRNWLIHTASKPVGKGTSIGKDSKVYIMETLWDRQRYETASYCLTQISLYFTAMANGNSKMFHSDDLIRCIENAGLEVEEIQDNIGLGHSILQCRLK